MKFKSKNTPVSAPAEKVFAKLSNLENLRSLLDKAQGADVPGLNASDLEKIEITADSITLPAGPAGVITLLVTERSEPTLIRMEAQSSPVPMTLLLVIEPKDAESCEVRAEIEIEIPIMLKPMVSGPLQKMVDQFGMILQHIDFNA